jgi:simple sugar transport system permease protein
MLAFLLSAFVLSCPLILAAMGGLVSERSGIINIALEGNMLTAAVVTAIVGTLTGSAVAGLSAGIGASIVASWMHWLFTQMFRIDHIVSGMALNVMAMGLADFLAKRFSNPDAGQVPTVSPLIYYGAAVLIPLAIALYLRQTRGGLRLTAVGEDPGKARQSGLFPLKIRFLALTATGFLCGLSGALIVSNARYYTDNMTAGRGYIALAALILGAWRPIPALLACLVFGMFQALQIQLQGVPVLGVQLPREVWYSLPYLVTIIALAGFLGKGKSPAGLGKF